MRHIREIDSYLTGLMSTDINEWPHMCLIPLCAAQIIQYVALLGAGISRYIGYFDRSHITSLTKKGVNIIFNNNEFMKSL